VRIPLYTSIAAFFINVGANYAFIFGKFGAPKMDVAGAAIGTLINGVRVGIGVDGEMNSIALKYGMLSGLISVGAKTFDFGNCFYSQMFYYSIFCDVDIVVFISGGENGVSLSICEKGGVALSRENMRRLEEVLISGEFNRTTGADCHNVNVIESIEKMYENEIV
jgi:phosphomannomutase